MTNQDMCMTDPQPTFTIRIAGIQITAPTDLIKAAGYTVYAGGDVDDPSKGGFLTRRLIRVLSEQGITSSVSGPAAFGVLARVVELGECEAADRRRETNMVSVARLEASAAAAHLQVAQIERDAFGDCDEDDVVDAVVVPTTEPS